MLADVCLELQVDTSLGPIKKDHLHQDELVPGISGQQM